jgi:hypothetical protein
MAVIQYILIATVCLSIFYLVYRLLYRNEANFRHLRIFLMGSVVVSLLVPLNRFTVDIVKKNQTVITLQELDNPPGMAERASVAQTRPVINWQDMISKLYFTVTVLLLCRILLQLVILASQYVRSEKVRHKNCTLLLNHRFRNSFSFFNWIFITRDTTSQEDLDQIIAHERIHASQYHAVDLIVIELLTAVMWFNPLIWMMKNTVQLVHEYLADEGALNTGIDRLRYQVLLVNQVTEERLICLSSSFNHALIKKRMKMITNNKFNRKSRRRVLALLPLTVALFFAMAVVNGFFPERIQAGPSSVTSALSNTNEPERLPLSNLIQAQDTIKKKTVIKVISKGDPQDTVITETIEVIVDDDTTRTVKMVGHTDGGEIMHGDKLIFISEDEDIEHLNIGESDSVKVVKVYKHSSEPGGTDKNVIIIRNSKDVQWETSDKEIPSNTLVIVDGVEQKGKDPLAGLDPDQIVTVTVIKDKKSMKQYTDKDYEGVIVVTTKKK